LNRADRYRGALVGLAAGDAVGTTVEFQPRGTFAPVTDMVGGGPFGLQPGQWTDDTSMALCLAESLIARGGFDAHDQMTRYLNWWRWGHRSSTGKCFDIGMTVRDALARFERTGDPWAGSTDPRTAGNGSLMRLAPVVLWAHPDLAQARQLAAASSRTTHAAAEAVEACMLFAELLHRALEGAAKDEVLAAPASEYTEQRVAAIARGDYLQRPESGIRGTGYVIESLEAALWCFAHSSSFEEAVLRAANLGDDADTTAAIVGQIAGAHWGFEAIPPHWRQRLHACEEICEMADRLGGGRD
jgi:ADP-ribosyl-[dinitrogen reductase] hydrolase